jgi:hypothetical protein
MKHVFYVVASASTDPDPRIFKRATTEPFALDSFQNLLFSLARFYEVTGAHASSISGGLHSQLPGRYPEVVTVVGYEMKRKRFEQLHRKAVRWPAVCFDIYHMLAALVDVLPSLDFGT